MFSLFFLNPSLDSPRFPPRLQPDQRFLPRNAGCIWNLSFCRFSWLRKGASQRGQPGHPLEWACAHRCRMWVHQVEAWEGGPHWLRARDSGKQDAQARAFPLPTTGLLPIAKSSHLCSIMGGSPISIPPSQGRFWASLDWQALRRAPSTTCCPLQDIWSPPITASLQEAGPGPSAQPKK